MSWSNGISYGEAITKAIWNYFGLSAYFKLQWSKIRGGIARYTNAYDLWNDNNNRTKVGSQLKLSHGKPVELGDFYITQWFPWMPGMYWTDYGRRLRETALGHILPDELEYRVQGLNSQNQADWRMTDMRNPLLSPEGKTLSVLSGIGGVRLNELGLSNGESVQILGATTAGPDGYDRNPNVSGGIPLVVNKNAYESIRNKLSSEGVVTATIQGFFTDMSESIADVWLRNANVRIPSFCIYVGSSRMIKDIEKGPDVLTAGWSIFEQENSKDYSMAFCQFNVTDEKGRKEAGQFLEDYIVRRYNGAPLTNYDEKEQMLPARYDISKIKQGDFNMRAMHELILKIRRKYPPDYAGWESRINAPRGPKSRKAPK